MIRKLIVSASFTTILICTLGQCSTFGSNEKNEVSNATVDPQLSIEWDHWNRRITEEVWNRFVGARKNFLNKALSASLSYDVTNDGKVINVRILAHSQSPEFDAMCLKVVTSLNGDSALLEFPQGRTTLVKSKCAVLYTPKYHVPGRY